MCDTIFSEKHTLSQAMGGALIKDFTKAWDFAGIGMLEKKNHKETLRSPKRWFSGGKTKGGIIK